MPQRDLFRNDLNNVINVSKVKQLSPFRFPGGKTWLVPWVRLWIYYQKVRPRLFIEPFAGGGIISLTVAAENLADKAIMVELDDQVASVWRTIFNRNWKWLTERITNFELNYENAKVIIDSSPRSIREKAFQTILKNRIYHGGILADGSGMLKYGENGKGIHSRWYPETIKKRICQITDFRNRIQFTEDNGISIMNQYANETKAICFIDPPYTAGGKRAGRRLYRLNDVDHDKIFYLAAKMKADCLLTYNESDEVRELAKKYKFEIRTISMQNTHLAKMNELIISKDLSWLD